MAGFIYDFGILFLVIVVISFLAKLLKQPIILGYVTAGLLFSYLIAEGSASRNQIIIISELGITFLLFLMGLEFDFKSLKYLGKDIFIATIMQSLIFFGIAGGTSILFGFSLVESAYVGILFMFSSTLLVAKWLNDKKESSTLYGKIVLGILIVQDLFAIVALSILGVVQEGPLWKIFLTPLTGILLLLLVFVFARYILNRLLKVAIKYPELFFIFSLGVCFLFVEIAPLLGYSTTIGAFLGGVTLANTFYKNDIHSRLKPLIVFFNMLFFVGLGFQIKLGLDLRIALLIASLCILSLFVKPFVIYLTLKIRGYDLKTSFLAGLSLAQESEFGMIIVLGGISGGLITGWVGTVAVISILATMIASSYFIKYDKHIFLLIEKRLRKIDRLFPVKEVEMEGLRFREQNIIFFGYYDIGRDLFAKLSGMGKKILVIESDPANIEILKKEGIPHVYHSISSPDFFEHIDLTKTELVVSSLIDINDNKVIIKEAKESNPKSTVIVTAKNLKESLELYNNNADYVIYPSYINEQRVSVLLEDYTTDINKVITQKINDINALKEIDKKRSESIEKAAFFDIEKFFRMAPKANKKGNADIINNGINQQNQDKRQDNNK